MEMCPLCHEDTLQHLHDTVCGIPQTHMKNTERYVCSNCGFRVYEEQEAIKYGLKFVLDNKE